MKQPNTNIGVFGFPVFLRRRLMALGLSDKVRPAMHSMGGQGILTHVKPPKWTRPEVKPLKLDCRTTDLR